MLVNAVYQAHKNQGDYNMLGISFFIGLAIYMLLMTYGSDNK